MKFGHDDEFRFNDASTHEGPSRQNGELTWYCNETVIMISHICMKKFGQNQLSGLGGDVI